ncbi:glycosyltransferase family 2 protein [Selenomonas sp. TAMA-11512]|uniref:glycosyltransferase family 2 protein n=1 Tax=Selenomonas sp. TAMA-11512 TaxID=3095337 RepID=UPI0030929639|nr:glycosyltransferase family 2 protein [Selenomonas sp. TAMA-11512]
MQERNRLAVIVLTKNEEANIRDCIESVSFADEVLLVDSGSTDRTIEIAQSMGARIVSRPMGEGGFAENRNAALQETEAEWVLYLDADERIEKTLEQSILQHIRSVRAAGTIRRESVVMGQRMHHGVYRPDEVARLFPREAVRWEGIVHEMPVTELPVARLKGAATHYCLTSWAQYFAKFDRYTTMMAEKMRERGKRTNYAAAQLHAIYACFQMLFLRGGILDGALGVTLCAGHYLYTLMKYVKLMELDKGRPLHAHRDL